jgi:hypothetical protein
MKHPKFYAAAKQRLFKASLLSVIALICFSYQAYAQWSFTFHMQALGNCPDASSAISYANSMLSSIPNMGLPTKSMCDALRQQILAISVSGGGCTISYTCSECSGSDLASQAKPGDVSFNAASQGVPFFTVHQSSAFQDWARDYKQQLEAYGITSILGKTFATPPIALTGNKDFDDPYNKLSASFINPAPANNPPAINPPKSNPPNQDASVVDLSGKAGVVQLLTTPEEQKERDKWYQEHGFNNLTPVSTKDGISPDGSPSFDENSTVYKSVDGMLDKIGENPNGVLAAYIGKTELSLVKNVFKYLDDVNNALKNGTTDELVNNNPNPEQTVVLAVAKEQANDKFNEIQGNVTKSVTGALENAGGKVMTYMYGKNGAEGLKTTLNTISTATSISNNINKVVNWVGSLHSDNH